MSEYEQMVGEWEYKAGDYIGAELPGGGYIEGEIKEVINDPQKGILTLVLDNGWRVYPIEYQRSGVGNMVVKYFPKKEKRTIEDLPLNETQKRYVLEWLAWKFYGLLIKLGIEDGYCKFYDPLLIEDDKCHSYVFDLDDDGRHHPYKNLREIEDKLFNEVVKRIKEESVH